ncbi:carbohydrate ABC transporter permease [Enterococcus sp. BWR-S5]|uniref:carbohydrate ABC transporter permease n=1 Tax=Enterococcus sp. BWR-S5 TaxID=2787714 RepID=UPI0019229B85|nr:carbohydrate ABC transporter permease [Enterococcus sp. BWR-S5]MBL1224087.1 carbohydrate ABC transporter permease [Enterococcus sp. BWR-S5]
MELGKKKQLSFSKTKSNVVQDKDSKIFNLVNVILLLVFTVVIVVPIWNIVASSFASSTALAEGNFIFWPSEISFENYNRVLKDPSIWRSLLVSVGKTVIGVLAHTLFCAIMAYALSKRDLKGRTLYSTMGIITMFFTGGMIPTYLLIKSLGLLNTFWVYIIPALLSYYDVIILMNFFRDVPVSLEESAKIDGASDWKVFTSIYAPLSKPALATIALFHGVWQWNDFMTAKLYVTDKALYPLQMKLYEIITQSQAASSQGLNAALTINTTSKGVQLATIVITTVPIIMIYPLLQRHFISGMMLGAVKE